MLVLTQGNNNIKKNVHLCVKFRYIFTFTVSSLNNILVQLILFVPTGHTYNQLILKKNQVKTFQNDILVPGKQFK